MSSKSQRKPKRFVAPIYINPLTDFGFKKVFLNKMLLISFLKSILKEVDIVGISYRPTEMLGEWETNRKAVLDLLCETSDGQFIIVEMQRGGQRFFADRALLYASTLIHFQAPKGKWNYELRAVYIVAVLDFLLFENEKIVNPITTVQLYSDQQPDRPFSDKLKMVFIELPKFTKTEEELETLTDKWLFALRDLHKLMEHPPALQGRIFEELFKITRYKSLTIKDMKAYRSSVLDYDDVKEALIWESERSERRGLLKGERLGLLKGERLGLVKGERLGLLKAANNLIARGSSLQDAADATGLSIDDIIAYRNRLDESQKAHR